MYRIGTVPYRVAKPLTAGLDEDPQVELVHACPAKLADMLANDQLDCALASSVLCLGESDFQLWADGPVIASVGAIKSVLLFLRPGIDSINDIKIYSADPNSRTGRALTQIVLKQSKVAATMIEGDEKNPFALDVDAVQLIGDPALDASSTHPDWKIIDLGSEWRRLTNLPFVFAGWIFKDQSTFAEIAPLLDLNSDEISDEYSDSGLTYHLPLKEIELSLQQLAQWI
ncbi:MAG: hypothetical protein QGF46_00920 [Planctomycetota bacterium]|jgi:predicted solute-binding protein|nr:hypothetical protein [Planctomycetota bacterium]